MLKEWMFYGTDNGFFSGSDTASSAALDSFKLSASCNSQVISLSAPTLYDHPASYVMHWFWDRQPNYPKVIPWFTTSLSPLSSPTPLPPPTSLNVLQKLWEQN